MKKNSLANLALVSVVMAATCLEARASVTMNFTWTGTAYESGFTDTYINSADAIGIYAFNVTDTGGTGIPNPFYSVCLSPAGLLDGNSHTYNVLPFNQANPGIYPSSWAWNNNPLNPQYWGVNNAAYLWNRFGMGIVNGSTDRNQQAAALEFAVWTSLYDSTAYGHIGSSAWAAPTSQMGSATDPHSTLYYYNGFISALNSSGINGAQFTGNILEGQGAVSGGANSGQSQEFFMLGTPIPEASTMITGGLMLLPFGVSAFRFVRKTRVA